MKTSALALVVALVVGLFSLRTFVSLRNLAGISFIEGDDVSWIPHKSIRNNTSSEESPINDKTLQWDASKRRLWMMDGGSAPPAVVTLTSMYWNHPNQSFGTLHFRTQGSRRLLEGVLNHPWFHPTAWDDIVEGRWNNSGTRVYAFFDYETCYEKNFPDYGKGLAGNADVVGNRSTDWKSSHPQNPYRALVNRLSQIQMKEQYPNNMLLKAIIFECGGEGPRYYCFSRSHNPHEQVSLASISASPWHHFPQDQGFPPPVVKESILNETIRRNIAECREDTRPYLLTFAGNFRAQVRKQLRDFVHNDKDILFGNNKMTEKMGIEFEELVLLSKFGAAPRGDNRFSYRFVEVMSGGAIPVLYADDLVLPFEEVIDWREIAVLIPENETNRTREILSAISDEERCRMRQKMMQVYERYIKSGEATIAGIVDGLEKKFQSNKWTSHRFEGSRQ